jgi:hypothetical protein
MKGLQMARLCFYLEIEERLEWKETVGARLTIGLDFSRNGQALRAFSIARCSR